MKNLHRFCLASGFILTVAIAPVRAQQHAPMPGMDMAESASGSGESTAEFKAADETMMKDMGAPGYSGDADREFVAHMIPHHQGGIEMAQIELKYGKDLGLKRLAGDIIKAQHDEIAFMQRWQAKHGAQ